MAEKLGRYRLMKLLSTGGMGEVFLARQDGPAGFAKAVVIKRILRHLAQDQGFIDSFLNEAQLAAQLQHPNIAQVYGLEREGQAWFMVMEYVHGRSVRDLVETARDAGRFIPPAVAARIASQALQGLHYAHQLTDARGKPLGILHRDVTPENLLVSFSGVVKLVDFGIARAMTGSAIRVGRPKGKVAYMAPELTVAGGAVDGRADVFGVGVVLYELLRGQRPANAPSSTGDAALGARRAYEPDPALPGGLNAILARSMAIAPSDRYPTAQAMSEALDAWLASEGSPGNASELVAFLEALYGREALDANPAVLPLRSDDGASVAVAVIAGTQPFNATPHLPLDVSRSLIEPLPLPEGERSVSRVPWRPRVPEARWHRPVAAAALLVLAALLALRLGCSHRPRADAPSVAPAAEAAVGAAPRDAGPVQGDEANLVDATADRPAAESARSGARGSSGKSRQGTVSFRVSTGTEVLWGGRSLGLAPLDPLEVPAGTATFVLRHRKHGSVRRVTVRVPAGGTVVVR